MPGTTPHGFPYAEPTDPLVQWPATSQQLAEKIDAEMPVMGTAGLLIQRGEATSDATAGHATVTFPVPYRDNLSWTLVATALMHAEGTTVQPVNVQIEGRTGSSCTLRTAPSTIVSWIAIGVAAG